MTEGHPGAKGARFDWDDLRYVLAVARHGSAGGAARALDVAHATVLRRIQAIEQDFGMRSRRARVPERTGRERERRIEA